LLVGQQGIGGCATLPGGDEQQEQEEECSHWEELHGSPILVELCREI
jgi:hypothetical protein